MYFKIGVTVISPVWHITLYILSDRKQPKKKKKPEHDMT